jgi:hypothetical protein
MALTQKECQSALAALSMEEQKRFLLILGHELTIVGREAYEFQGEGVINSQLLRDLNEIHHRLYSQIRDLVLEQKVSFSPESLASWLTAEGNPNTQAVCLAAFERSLAYAREVI